MRWVYDEKANNNEKGLIKEMKDDRIRVIMPDGGSWIDFMSIRDKDQLRTLFDDLNKDEIYAPRGKSMGHTIPRDQAFFYSGPGNGEYKFGGKTYVGNKDINPAVGDFMDIMDEIYGKFNFAVVNRYKNSKDSLSPHADNESIIVPGSPIPSLSLGGPRTFTISLRDKNSRINLPHGQNHQKLDMVLTNGQIIVMGGNFQLVYNHSIPKELSRPDETRINITLRKFIEKAAPEAKEREVKEREVKEMDSNAMVDEDRIPELPRGEEQREEEKDGEYKREERKEDQLGDQLYKILFTNVNYNVIFDEFKRAKDLDELRDLVLRKFSDFFGSVNLATQKVFLTKEHDALGIINVIIKANRGDYNNVPPGPPLTTVEKSKILYDLFKAATGENRERYEANYDEMANHIVRIASGHREDNVVPPPPPPPPPPPHGGGGDEPDDEEPDDEEPDDEPGPQEVPANYIPRAGPEPGFRLNKNINKYSRYRLNARVRGQQKYAGIENYTKKVFSGDPRPSPEIRRERKKFIDLAATILAYERWAQEKRQDKSSTLLHSLSKGYNLGVINQAQVKGRDDVNKTFFNAHFNKYINHDHAQAQDPKALAYSHRGKQFFTNIEPQDDVAL